MNGLKPVVAWRLMSVLAGAICIVLPAGSAPAQSLTYPQPAVSLPASKRDCATCHADAAAHGPGALKRPLPGLCLDCHPDRVAPKEHRTGVPAPRAPDDLPLVNGMMTCTTCHDPHGGSDARMLRKPASVLCRSCHPV